MEGLELSFLILRMGGGVLRMDNFSDIWNGNVVRKYDSKDSGGGG